MKKITRVSDICAYWDYVIGKEWKFYESEEEAPTDAERHDALVRRLTSEHKSTPAQERGTAIHRLLEDLVALSNTREVQEIRVLKNDEMELRFECNAELWLPGNLKSEVEYTKEYRDLTVVGHVDGIGGYNDWFVVDWKTSRYAMKAEQFIGSQQWRFYLDLTGADSFKYVCLQVYEPRRNETAHRVVNFDTLLVHRYDGLHTECFELAVDFVQFVDEHCPQYWEMPKQWRLDQQKS